MMMFGKGIKSALEPIPPIIDALADAFVKILGATRKSPRKITNGRWSNT